MMEIFTFRFGFPEIEKKRTNFGLKNSDLVVKIVELFNQ